MKKLSRALYESISEKLGYDFDEEEISKQKADDHFWVWYRTPIQADGYESEIAPFLKYFKRENIAIDVHDQGDGTVCIDIVVQYPGRAYIPQRKASAKKSPCKKIKSKLAPHIRVIKGERVYIDGWDNKKEKNLL